MPDPLQSYRDYLDDVRQQVRWLDRVRFRYPIRQAIPGMLQQGEEGETLLSVLAAGLYISPTVTTMDSEGVVLRDAAEQCISTLPPPRRCLCALTSHGLHIFPFLSPTVTTFLPEQILPLWRIHNGLHTVEIPFFPPEAMALLERDESDDSHSHLKALVLRVDAPDWLAANAFWSAGLAAAAHWRDPSAIARHLESVAQKMGKR